MSVMSTTAADKNYLESARKYAKIALTLNVVGMTVTIILVIIAVVWRIVTYEPILNPYRDI